MSDVSPGDDRDFEPALTGEASGEGDDPGHGADARSREFEEMVDPPLADRLRAFEARLEAEECTKPFWVNNQKHPGCVIISNTSRMCPICRLKLSFYHLFYNAEAYEGGPGAIPRKEDAGARSSAGLTPAP